MTQEQKHQMDNVIRKYLDGTLSDEECRNLNGWLEKNREHADYFREFTCTAFPEQDESLDSSWNALNIRKQLRESADKLNMHPKTPWGRKVFHMTRIQLARYAALLVIGLITIQISHNQVQNYLDGKQGMQWIQAETEAGQKTRIVLPDSSIVWLNSESAISFPSDFESQKERIIKLDGEAFFDVASQGRSRFIVKCSEYDVEVKGTKFNVMAYSDFDRTETTLVEGEVQILKGDQRLTLGPGERAIASRNFLTKSKAHVRQATLWKENKFYFDNVPFWELARRLERWYDVKITLADPSLEDIYYSGYFKNEETVWQVLDVIQITTPIVYERKQFREITITSNTK